MRSLACCCTIRKNQMILRNWMSFISFFNTYTVKHEVEWWPVYSCLLFPTIIIIVKVFVFITSTIYVFVDHTCRNFCCVTFTIIHRNKGLASVVSVYTHGYVTAVWGLLGAEKENESCIFFFFFIKSVRANGDLIDSVLGNFWWRKKLFLVLSMGCEMRQL